MARVNNISTLVQSIKQIPELARFVASALDSILTQFNGKIDFGDNIRTFGPVTVEFSNTLPTKINHGLGRTPVGYFVTSTDQPMSVYTPNLVSFPWTDSQLFVQTDVSGGVADIMIF